MFDLKAIDTKSASEKGAPLIIKNFDNTPLLDRDGAPVTLMLMGPDSELYRTVTRENVRLRLQKRAQAAVDGGKMEVTADDLEAGERENLELLIQMTVGWSGMWTPEGEPIIFSPAKVRELYESFPVVREQAEAFIGRRANFITASSKG